MTIEQFNICRHELDLVPNRTEFLKRFQDVDPGELVDVWTILQDYSFAAVRSLSGLTQDEFSGRYGIPPTTVRAWTLTRMSTNRRNIQPYLLDLLAVDVINDRADRATEKI